MKTLCTVNDTEEVPSNGLLSNSGLSRETFEFPKKFPPLDREHYFPRWEPYRSFLNWPHCGPFSIQQPNGIFISVNLIYHFPTSNPPLTSFHTLNSNPKSSARLTQKPYMLWPACPSGLLCCSARSLGDMWHLPLPEPMCKLASKGLCICCSCHLKKPSSDPDAPKWGYLSTQASPLQRGLPPLRASQRPYLKISFQSSAPHPNPLVFAHRI